VYPGRSAAKTPVAQLSRILASERTARICVLCLARLSHCPVSFCRKSSVAGWEVVLFLTTNRCVWISRTAWSTEPNLLMSFHVYSLSTQSLQCATPLMPCEAARYRFSPNFFQRYLQSQIQSWEGTAGHLDQSTENPWNTTGFCFKGCDLGMTKDQGYCFRSHCWNLFRTDRLQANGRR
jgi:hypothetical protein